MRVSLVSVAVAVCHFFIAPALHALPPAGWVGDDLGSPALIGSYTSTPNSNKATIWAAGTGIGGTTDQGYFLHGALTGDGEIVARVGNQTNTNGAARAGVMLRASLSPDSPYVAVFLTPNSGIYSQYRATAGGTTAQDGSGNVLTPIWLKVTRIGNRFTAYRSDDAQRWSQVGDTSTLSLPNTLLAGLAQTSLNPNVRGTADYDGLALTNTAGGTTSGGVTPTATLIGTADTLGSATIHPDGSACTLQTNAPGQEGTTDRFIYLHSPLVNDDELVARVASIDYAAGWNKTGIALRTSLAPDAVSFSAYITGSNGLLVERRTDTGAATRQTIRLTSMVAPVWFKAARHSSFYTLSYSQDGVTWTPLGDPITILGTAPIYAGLAVSSQRTTEFAAARFDQLRWPTPTANPPPAETDPVILKGLAAWRKPDPNGISCMNCHTPFGYDIAQFNFTQADVRLATTPHLSQDDADSIHAMLEKYRVRFPLVGGLKDFRTHRPLQPGGGQVLGGESATPDARDYAFGRYLQTHFRFAQERITTLAQARAAAQELIDVDVASVPVGLKFNLWSRSALREGPVMGGEIAEWLPSAGLVPKPEFAAAWMALQEAYVRDPSNDNLWALYEASGKWVDPDAHNFDAGVNGNWRYIVVGQFRANLLLAHDELLKARGLPSLLAAEDGVRPFRSVRASLTTDMAPFWNVGDNARVVQNRGLPAMPRRNRESVHNDTSYNNNLDEVNGWQINDFRLTWFWLGWMRDNSLRFSGEGSTLSGEYFIGSLWAGEVDNPRTGDSDSIHGYRMHQVFFNAVQQFKLGYKPGAWRDGDTTPQHFEASKGYYLGYNRWYPPHGDPTEPGLEGSGPLYRRLLSNHLRMALLVHADEARKLGGVYYNENFTLNDIPLWRQALAWADPDWSQADEALFAELRASLTPNLTPDDLALVNGVPAIVAAALGIPAAGGAGTGVQYGVNPAGRLSVTFVRARSDLSYVVEGTGDLSSWQVIATNPGTAGQTVTVSDPASSTGAGRRFLRVRIIKALP